MKRFLIVDDCKIILDLFCDMIGSRAEVVTASSVSQAQMLYQTAEYDIVFTDYHMPELSGKEFIEFIFRINPSQHIVCISGDDVRNKIPEKVELILKPFSPEQITKFFN